MSVSKAWQALLCGAALVLLPAPALAQNTVTADNVVVNNVVPADDFATMGNTTTEREHEDRDFPWGLLGLLGLAGLLGLKRRDDDRDIHVDARRDTAR